MVTNWYCRGEGLRKIISLDLLKLTVILLRSAHSVWLTDWVDCWLSFGCRFMTFDLSRLLTVIMYTHVMVRTVSDGDAVRWSTLSDAMAVIGGTARHCTGDILSAWHTVIDTARQYTAGRVQLPAIAYWHSLDGCFMGATGPTNVIQPLNLGLVLGLRLPVRVGVSISYNVNVSYRPIPLFVDLL